MNVVKDKFEEKYKLIDLALARVASHKSFNDNIARKKLHDILDWEMRDIGAEYVVTCDETNNTPFIIEQGDMKVQVSVKDPLSPVIYLYNMSVLELLEREILIRYPLGVITNPDYV